MADDTYQPPNNAPGVDDSIAEAAKHGAPCLLYTSPSPRDS